MGASANLLPMGSIRRFFRRGANTTALRAADPVRSNVVPFGRSQRKSPGAASARPGYLRGFKGSWLVVIACAAFVGYAAVRDGMFPAFLGGSGLFGILKGGETIDLREAHVLDGGTFLSDRSASGSRTSTRRRSLSPDVGVSVKSASRPRSALANSSPQGPPRSNGRGQMPTGAPWRRSARVERT
jgi:hypothetical protein